MLVGVVVAGGCAHAPVTPRRAPVAHAGNQGGSWELVLPGSGVATRLADAEPGAELARRDEALSLRTPDDAWPPSDVPSLSRTRRLHLRSRPDEILYFRRGEPHHHHWWPHDY